MTNLNNWFSKYHKKPSTIGRVFMVYYVCLVFDHCNEIIKQVT